MKGPSSSRMGLTKEYLRYIPAGNFNIIASNTCNIKFVTLEGQEGRFVAVGACEHIIIWDLRLGEKAQVLPGEKAVVTAICQSPNKRHLAAGYADGNVQIYDLKTAEVVSIFAGHKSEITSLVYDNKGHKLASGSKDTDVIVWDTVAETGVCRLSGHKGSIIQVMFMSQYNYLISGGKDNFVKFWDLDTQHCFKTLTGLSKLLTFTLMKDDQFLVANTDENSVVFWKLMHRGSDDPVKPMSMNLEQVELDEADDLTHPLQCYRAGVLVRKGKGPVTTMSTDGSGHILGYHGRDRLLELFYFCTDEEALTRMKKRLQRKRLKEKKNAMETDEPESQPNEDRQLGLKDEVKQLTPIQLSDKPKSLDLLLGTGGELRVAVSLSSNIIQLYRLQTSMKNVEPYCLRTISSQGHHGEIRAVCFSNDNQAIVSGSAESVKMWNRSSQVCLKTIETGYVLSIAFVPGDHYVLAGLKDGNLLIIDISVGDIIETIPAHTAELWSICLQPSQNGIVTGGSDKTVKFWQFELIADEKSESSVKVLSLLHSRTLKLEDDVLCVRLSPNGKFVAAALLDSTVKIFFVDSFKFYLSLYGHKLPVVCMDISSDSHLIVTGSGDKNVKIWGMDFGDCHKSIFAHEDPVTAVQFVPKTRYFFTCGKDGKVKQWDGDKFNKIITLQGHAGEARALSVSPNGQFVVSCGSDRVLRLYEKSDQPLVLQDEEEEQREQEEAEAIATEDQTVVPGKSGLNLPSKRTIGSDKAAESILECLEVCVKYTEELEELKATHKGNKDIHSLLPVPLLMQAFNATNPHDFLLETIKRIRPSDLEEALLLLPFSSVCEVLQMLPPLIKRGDHVELISKVSIFLLKLHHAPIVANHSLQSTLQELKKLEFERVQGMMDMIGKNLYQMKFWQREIESAESVQLFRETIQDRKRGEKKRKQREKLKRSAVVLTVE